MQCPSLDELPRAPLNKEGWPWTEESKNIDEEPTKYPDFPSISIITPNLNQAKYLEETIRSVLLQGYPCLEYIIIDGGSTDGSLEIIKKYEKWLTYWASESDTGQSNALNKGFRQATGTIVAWLNSDDIYEIDSICKVAILFATLTDTDIIYGDGEYVDEECHFIDIGKSKCLENTDVTQFIPNQIFQPSLFFKRKILDQVGFLDESLHFAMDVDFWIRAFSNRKTFYTENTLSKFKLHQSGKTTSASLRFLLEELKLIGRYAGTQSLFNQQLGVYTYKKSIIDNISCEAAYELIIGEMETSNINRQYITNASHVKAQTITNAYLWDADYFYNALNLVKCRENLSIVLKKSPLKMLSTKFFYLLFASRLPIRIIKWLRTTTRSSQINAQGRDWLKGH